MLSCDLLVVGGGGAALRAALAARETESNLHVVLVTKGALGQSGVTATACSDRMAFHATLASTEPGGDDAWRYHADDIYRIGGSVSDADLAQILARNAAQAFDYLDHLGVPWARRADGGVDQFVTDGSAYARACYTGPRTANHIEEALVRRARELSLEVIEHCMVAELLLDDEGCIAGAALIDEGTSQVRAITAKAIVLATGGAGQIFADNVFPTDCTGDGYALAYRAGAELVNLEFIQLGLCSVKTKLACSGSMMRALPRLVDENGTEFLPRYFPTGTDYAAIYAVLYAKGASWPVSYREPSHIIDIAVAAERAEGHRVYLDYGADPVGLDLSQLDKHLLNWYVERGVVSGNKAAATPLMRLKAINQPSIDWLAERGVDLAAGDMIELAPSAQHFQGGVKIRTSGETTVPGLYAAGETAGGQHGANRPGGNALLDSQVFGQVAGQCAAQYAYQRKDCVVAGICDEHAEQVVDALLCPDGDNPTIAREAVGAQMSLDCGVHRTQAGLTQLVMDTTSRIERGICNSESGLAHAIESTNILTVAQMVALAALQRDESRGPHLRFDHERSTEPMRRRDPDWARYIVISRSPQGPVLRVENPVRPD